MTMVLKANGQEFFAWHSISVEASMKDAVRSFTAVVTENSAGNFGGGYFIPPGTPVQIYSDGELLLDGYTNVCKPSFSATDHKVEISGRGKGQDSTDSSAEHETGRFEGMTALDIANNLASKVNNQYTSKISFPSIRQFQINQGETIHQVARRLAAHYGATIMGKADGTMEFCKAESNLIGQLSEGLYPLLSASAELKDQNSHSNYKFKSQLTSYEDKYNEDAAHHVAEVSNSEVKRYRPKIKVLDKAADSSVAQTRAEWQASRMGGESAKVDAVIHGHRLGGTLVEPNRTIMVVSQMLHISNEMLVEKVVWSQDQSGTKTNISLVPPAAYGGSAGSSSGKGSTDGSTSSASQSTTSSSSSRGPTPATAYGGAKIATVPSPKIAGAGTFAGVESDDLAGE